MIILQSFLFALFATIGICILFHVPIKNIPVAAIIGAITCAIEYACMGIGISEVIACFIAACGVGLMSDIASRVCKEAATIFIIPGILCLVPGAGMYQTMAAIVSDKLGNAAEIATQTLMIAGAIALGLLVVGGVIRVIVAIIRRASYITTKM